MQFSSKFSKLIDACFCCSTLAYVEDLLLDADALSYVTDHGMDFDVQHFDVSLKGLAYGYLIKNETFAKYLKRYFQDHDLLFQTCLLADKQKPKVL